MVAAVAEQWSDAAAAGSILLDISTTSPARNRAIAGQLSARGQHFVEVSAFSAGTFPEPLAFSLRAWDHLRKRKGEFDLVHDNQSLGYGLLAIQREVPVLGTIHHPITVDRRLEIEHAQTAYKRLTLRRWYAFTKMQTSVAKRLKRIITVSESSRTDIVKDHGVDPSVMHVVPVGVDHTDERSSPQFAEPVSGGLDRGGAFYQHEAPLAGPGLVREPDAGGQYGLIAGRFEQRPRGFRHRPRVHTAVVQEARYKSMTTLAGRQA